MHETHAVTQLLDAVRTGDPAAADRLWQAVYQELHRMAEAKMAREANLQTLQPTALVHEAYLRLCVGGEGRFENRRHFFAAAARAMHQICVDYARQKGSIKRGGETSKSQKVKTPKLEDAAADAAVVDRDPTEVLAVDEALQRLADEDAELVEVVRLRYFVGLGLDETAEVLGVSRRTVAYRWRLAKAWLYDALA